MYRNVGISFKIMSNKPLLLLNIPCFQYSINYDVINFVKIFKNYRSIL